MQDVKVHPPPPPPRCFTTMTAEWEWKFLFTYNYLWRNCSSAGVENCLRCLIRAYWKLQRWCGEVRQDRRDEWWRQNTDEGEFRGQIKKRCCGNITKQASIGDQQGISGSDSEVAACIHWELLLELLTLSESERKTTQADGRINR